MLQSFDRVLAASGDVPLEDDIRFSLKNAVLIVYQGEAMSTVAMTYGVLRAAVAGLVGFMLDYGSFAFNVEVLTTRGNRKISSLILTFI